MFEMFKRLSLTDLTPAQIAVLDALIPPAWPETWRNFATSHFVTLLSAPGADAVALGHLAHLALALTLGIAQDEGGTQPYIPVGADVMGSARARRVIELLGQHLSYKQVADLTGITASQVRKIQRAWRHAQAAARQGLLPLD